MLRCTCSLDTPYLAVLRKKATPTHSALTMAYARSILRTALPRTAIDSKRIIPSRLLASQTGFRAHTGLLALRKTAATGAAAVAVVCLIPTPSPGLDEHRPILSSSNRTLKQNRARSRDGDNNRGGACLVSERGAGVAQLDSG